MAGIKKQRYQEIQAEAAALVQAAGGPAVLDAIEDVDARRAELRRLEADLIARTGIKDKRTAAKALRRARFEIVRARQWGGSGRKQGAPPRNDNAKKENRMLRTRCKNGQDAFSAAEEAFGKGATVDAFTNAYHSDPSPEYVKKYGQPVGTVTIRPREQVYAYRRK